MIERLVPSAASFSSDIDFVFSLIFWIVGFWLVVSEAVFFWLIWRFRKRDGVPGQYITGELKSEKRFITVPHIFIILFDLVIIAFAVNVWFQVKQQLPNDPDVQTVRITGVQWAWIFQHPGPDGVLDTEDDIIKVNELRVAKDQLYHFQLTSKDVLHSFSVPVFRLKQDAIPGRVIVGWFKPTLTGEFDIQCAEICGIGHGLMPARIHIETPEAHAAWMAEQAGISVASAER